MPSVVVLLQEGKVPEISASAAFLIAVSHQAIQRAEKASPQLFISESTTCIVSAVFFIEASVTSILIYKKWITDLHKRYGSNNPGLLPKMVFFVEKFPDEFNDLPWKRLEAYKPKEAMDYLDNKFPGFKPLDNFRNSVCHGDLKGVKLPKFVPISDYEQLSQMRQKAKNIVDRLIEISKLDSLRTFDYWEAYKSIRDENK